MASQASLNDVFRFIHLAPPKTVEESSLVALVTDTPLAGAIVEAPTPARRAALANRALAKNPLVVKGIEHLRVGKRILDVLEDLSRNERASTMTLVGTVAAPSEGATRERLAADHRALSDTLLATFHATESIPANLPLLQKLYRAYDCIVRAVDGPIGDVPLTTLFRQPILAPLVNTTKAPVPVVGPPPPAPPPPAVDPIEELIRRDNFDSIVHPDGNGVPIAGGRATFALTQSAEQSLSQGTRQLLTTFGLTVSNTPIHALIHEVSQRWRPARPPAFGVPPPVAPPIAHPTQSVQAVAQAKIRPAGIAKLLVVKQQIKRYEAAEIAHIENVLAGETKSRSHRTLERSEETVETETETIREQEHELETADRFELNRETSRTIKEDLSIGFGLSLSAKYGSTVEVSSNFELDSTKSTEETARSSSKYARDVMERSLERISERVREQRVRKLIRETEETNLHQLKNETGAHISGTYQFVDKVFEAQVFDYGIRQMFDFMIPEPASFLWYLETNPNAKLELPDPPDKLSTFASDAKAITPANFAWLAAKYGASDVDQAPPIYRMTAVSLRHGDDDASEGGHPHSSVTVEAKVPAGYQLWRASVRGAMATDAKPILVVTIGHHNMVWYPDAIPSAMIGVDGGRIAVRPTLYADFSGEPYDLTAESKLAVTALAWETNSYTLSANLVCRRTEQELDRWRQATYAKIRGAYDDRVREHEQLVEKIKAEAEEALSARLPFGAPPSENRKRVRTELKKHCISIITEQRFDDFDATKNGSPPYFDFAEAETEGSFIRFFEQAFEWDQLQYVFYPYYWARKSTWIDRFASQELDPEFKEFLQAGSARVVVPVRPGFEVAVDYFFETGKLWAGSGDPPEINSPLYVAIVDEIKERTGASKGEVVVGEPWEVRLPTPLVLLRSSAKLPEWQRADPKGWEWKPVD